MKPRTAKQDTGPRVHLFARGARWKRFEDMLVATAGEASLVLVVAGIGWAARQPLIFASLGPTAYELIEQPQLRSARTYNIIVGHLIGLGAGFLALHLLHAWTAPKILSTGIVTGARLWAVVLACALTTAGTLAANAGQPAALATTLLVSLGAMQTRHDGIVIVAGVLIMAAIGEPLRRFRLARTYIRPAVG